MDIRMSIESQADAKRVQCDVNLEKILSHFKHMSRWPWRECWVELVAGLALFHFCKWEDLRGEYRRVPVGVNHIKTATDADITALVHKILERASGIKLARPLAHISDAVAPLRHPVDRIIADLVAREQ